MNFARKEFYEQHKNLFCWYDADDYACYDVLTVSPKTIEKIKQAAANVWPILLQAADLMKSLDNETLLEFDYPLETLHLIKNSTQPPFIARCDFAVTNDNIFLLECNAEVATFIVETFKVNGIVANHFGKKDPNEESENILRTELNRYIRIAAAYLGKLPEQCHIIFSALSQADEDIGTVEYVRSLCEYQSAYCPIESITMDEEYVYDQVDRKVDIIYRLYPTEWMVEDKDPNLDVSLWDYLEPLIDSKKVALINPISSFVIQNKALMALITEVGLDYFGKNNATGYSHFIPTFLDESEISYPFVSKPTWGREGKEVAIFKKPGDMINNPSPDYSELMKIYQQYVDLPLINLEEDTYTLQLSCFLINGIPTGVGARIGKDLITNTSKFLPIGY
ncbi:glutathionylspermidine synthase family protein [Nodularia sphaerocarpa]|uniref:glutathionylspermidine synthase family protein n=1 Tax=Nodularia sphaerocarpa TaxID=137816 RepID=UPI00232C9564|nr:glutathionylspermidine synthase family protein [Nodularia sphaerocarpa]MDB9372329.1 glutathionylspermidine synthase family protein [Nodularia sphaerocarpa CS-585]MDB9377945.1 glutathionylspermidine synthase family protein [Nodularia sphaerocarpa CS-585A2]